jgi:hypothetical protein
VTVVDGVDYGPLACLIGTWKGEEGMDVAPDPDGTEENPYYESIVYEASGDVTNLETQTLAILRYHQVVKRKSNDKAFHNETGYLTWDSESGTVTQSFVIPRGVAIVAGGTGEIIGDGSVIDVSASLDSDDYTITQAPYMRDNASTQSFTHRIEVSGDSLSYEESTVIDIYGSNFDHTDVNKLIRHS